MSNSLQEIQTERLFRREPEYEALQNRRLSNPVLLDKYEQLLRKWNGTCQRLEDHQKRSVSWVILFSTVVKMVVHSIIVELYTVSCVFCRMELLHIVVELVVDLEEWISHVEEVLSHQPGLTKQSKDLHQQLRQLKVGDNDST